MLHQLAIVVGAFGLDFKWVRFMLIATSSLMGGYPVYSILHSPLRQSDALVFYVSPRWVTLVLSFLKASGPLTLDTLPVKDRTGWTWTLRGNGRVIRVRECVAGVMSGALAYKPSHSMGFFDGSAFRHAYGALLHDGVSLATPSIVTIGRSRLSDHRWMWKFLRTAVHHGLRWAAELTRPHECGEDPSCPATFRSSEDKGWLHLPLTAVSYGSANAQPHVPWSLFGLGCAQGTIKGVPIHPMCIPEAVGGDPRTSERMDLTGWVAFLEARHTICCVSRGWKSRAYCLVALWSVVHFSRCLPSRFLRFCLRRTMENAFELYIDTTRCDRVGIFSEEKNMWQLFSLKTMTLKKFLKLATTAIGSRLHRVHAVHIEASLETDFVALMTTIAGFAAPGIRAVDFSVWDHILGRSPAVVPVAWTSVERLTLYGVSPLWATAGQPAGLQVLHLCGSFGVTLAEILAILDAPSALTELSLVAVECWEDDGSRIVHLDHLSRFRFRYTSDDSTVLARLRTPQLDYFQLCADPSHPSTAVWEKCIHLVENVTYLSVAVSSNARLNMRDFCLALKNVVDINATRSCDEVVDEILKFGMDDTRTWPALRAVRIDRPLDGTELLEVVGGLHEGGRATSLYLATGNGSYSDVCWDIVSGELVQSVCDVDNRQGWDL
ncbi:hypothetical protein C8R46DRAFT_1188667 [Mycena filopes]|nr:hypothetical protein C8R46DRAFT_1188667 [Mycena filopes]